MLKIKKFKFNLYILGLKRIILKLNIFGDTLNYTKKKAKTKRKCLNTPKSVTKNKKEIPKKILLDANLTDQVSVVGAYHR